MCLRKCPRKWERAEILKITELGLEFYVLEKVPPQMGKSPIFTARCELSC